MVDMVDYQGVNGLVIKIAFVTAIEEVVVI